MASFFSPFFFNCLALLHQGESPHGAGAQSPPLPALLQHLLQRSSSLPRPQSCGDPHGILTPRTLSSSSHQLASSNAPNPRRVWMSEPTPLHFIGSLKTWFVTERSVASSCRAFRSHIHEFSELVDFFPGYCRRALHTRFCTVLLVTVPHFCAPLYGNSVVMNAPGHFCGIFLRRVCLPSVKNYFCTYSTFIYLVTLLQHKLLLYRACSKIRIQT